MDGNPPPPSLPSPPAAPVQTEAAPSYLTLGDGDFSYSLDLCRFLASTSSSKVASAAAHVTCSGIDSSDEVRAKYRDADSILRKISSLDQCHVAKRRAKKRRRLANNTEGESSPAVDPKPLSVRVEHGVNSIIMPGRNAELNTCNNRCYQHVIFNHPHIGHESAALHRRFLAHLFHTVDQHWLAPRGVFHLTLVRGQAGRWNCLEAAAKHGFSLLNRDAFRPPPPPSSRSTLGTETYFKSRRHQSGRSFATRSEGSETLTFGRICDEKKRYVARHLPWQNIPQTEIKTEDSLLQCPHCARSFRDERARKNHIKCSHPNGDKSGPSEGNYGKDPAISSAEKTFVCEHCKASAFSSARGLEDHIKAKHFGHTDIKPDWSKAVIGSQKEASGTDAVDVQAHSREAIGSCGVCGLTYYSPADEAAHMVEFIPQPVVGNGAGSTVAKEYSCSYCKKGFKDTRAVRQHENFCSKRPDAPRPSK